VRPTAETLFINAEDLFAICEPRLHSDPIIYLSREGDIDYNASYRMEYDWSCLKSSLTSLIT
jgi:hypothetical protein